MALYAFHDLTLEVKHTGENTANGFAQLLDELSWIRMPCSVTEPFIRLSVHLQSNGLRAPPCSRELFRADGFTALQHGDDFYLTNGSSLLHLQPKQAHGMAFIAPSFFTNRALLQSNFWAFSLLKLLRPLGLYSVHAATVVAKGGLGVLIIGPSGSGKSTLAIGLIRHGWSYLSDDAVLLRSTSEEIEVLALRKHFYIDSDAAACAAQLPLGEEVPDSKGRRRRRLYLERAFPAQHVARCVPRMLLFSRIVPQTQSSLVPVDRIDALRHLLTASGPQLFDKDTMTPHLQVLKRLVQQTVAYELGAGLDLYRDPMTLMRLLNEAEGAQRWPAL